MNIKLAAERPGVSSRNIRCYEQAGLLPPARAPENDYCTYNTEEDIRPLKPIHILRMLDMPLEEIRDVLAGSLPLPQAAGVSGSWYSRRFFYNDRDNQPFRGKYR